MSTPESIGSQFELESLSEAIRRICVIDLKKFG